ncbi:MFS transporter [bacterium RCC_150]
MTISENEDVVQQVSDIPPGRDSPGSGRSFKRVAFASFMGALIEAFDFGLYGVAAALVFPKVFFPSLGGAAGTIASLATLGVAFIGRPLGAVIFGYFGDKFGRKATLVATVLGMGIGTALMGVLPTADMIGIAAPILLVLLRFLQGLAIGGEWAGAVLFATEHAPPHRRGLYAMFPQLGGAFAVCLSAATLLVVGLFVDAQTFIAWGWRVPFVCTLVLVVIALYIRLKVEETPVFVKDRKRTSPARAPLFDALKNQPWTVLRAAGVALTTLAFVYTAQSFIANYGVSHLGLSLNQVLGATAIAGLVYAVFTGISATLSDRLGRRAVIGGANVAGVLWAFVLFPILNIGTIAAYGLALCFTMVIAGMVGGALGAFLPEQFPTRYRYTAAGVSYQLTGIIGGGITPLIAPVIVSTYGSFTFGVVLAALCAVAALCTFSLKNKAHDSMDWTLNE